MKKTTAQTLRIAGFGSDRSNLMSVTKGDPAIGNNGFIDDFDTVRIVCNLSATGPARKDGRGDSDIVALVSHAYGISESEALAKLVKLRVAIFDFLCAQGVKKWSDSRVSKDLRHLVTCLDSSDSVLMNLPPEAVNVLAEFHRP